jgi:hypothetical protein
MGARLAQVVVSLLAALCAGSLASHACDHPTVSILWPKNGTILSGVTGFDVQYNVSCARFPGDVFVRLWDVTTRATNNFADMFTWKVAQFLQVTEGTCELAGVECRNHYQPTAHKHFLQSQARSSSS